MKRISWLLLTWLLLTPGFCMAKSYDVSRTEIDCLIRQDGLVNWRESNTFTFDGLYTNASVALAFENGTYLSNIVVGENGFPYRYRYNGSPGSYWLSVDNMLNFSFEAENDIRTFDITYTIVGSVKGYADYGHFTWPIQLKTWDDPLENYTATFRLETPVPKNEIRAWLHGPMRAQFKIIDEQTIRVEIQGLSPEEVMDISILIPSRYFNMDKSDQEIGPNLIALEESRIEKDLQNYHLKVRQHKQRTVRDWLLGILLVMIACLLFFYVLYWSLHQGLEYHLSRKIPSIRQPLEAIPPGETAYLMKFYRYPLLAIQSILLDLIRKKKIRLVNQDSTASNQEKLVLVAKEDLERPPLLEYETTLLDEILIPVLQQSSKQSITDSEFSAFLYQNPKQYIPSIRKFKSQLQRAVKQQDFFDASKQRFSELIVSLCMTVLAVFVWIYIIIPRHFLLAIPAFIILFEVIGWMNLTRRSQPGTLLFKQYLQFRKFLRSPKEMEAMQDEDESEDTWEKYLVYSVPLEATKNTMAVTSSYLTLMENIGSNLLVQHDEDWSSSFKKILRSSFAFASVIGHYPSVWLQCKEKMKASKLLARIFIPHPNKADTL